MFNAWCTPFLKISTLILLAVFVAYKYLTFNHGKWKKLGVPFAEPTPLFGSMGDLIMGRVPLVDLMKTNYRRFDGQRYFGMYEVRKPLLVLRDPQLVHAIMVKDFSSFSDRIESKVSFEHDKLFDHLVNLRGDRWKSIRAKLTPTFSVAKLKSMMVDINECTSRLIAKLNEQLMKNDGNYFIQSENH